MRDLASAPALPPPPPLSPLPAPPPAVVPPPLETASLAVVPPAAVARSDSTERAAKDTAMCDPDGPPCAVVTALTTDPGRDWLTRTPTRNDTLSGVRLQALRSTVARLNCTELETARDEARAAVPTLEDALAEARVAGRPVSRLSRTLLLASDLATKLGEEKLKRCPT